MNNSAIQTLVVATILIGVVVLALRARQAAPLGDRGPATVRGQTITRSYRGPAHQASEAFQRDAAILAGQGYVPVSQIYTPGSWGCAAFLIALVLFVVLIGLLIFIYMLIVKPAGVLVVTYDYRPAAASQPPAPAAVVSDQRDPAAALASLATMRERGLISPEEFEAKKAELLERM